MTCLFAREKPMKMDHSVSDSARQPRTMIGIRMPEGVVEELKRIVPLLGFSGYQ